MSGINDVLKGDGCVLKKWVCRSQSRFVLCVCVSLFPGSVLDPLQNNLRCCSALLTLCFEALRVRFKRK